MNKYLANLLILVTLSATINAETNLGDIFPKPETSIINVGSVSIDGEIGDFKSTFLDIKAHAENKNIDCIVLFINSGGGSPGDSEILTDYISEIKKSKPVVAFVSNTAASGAYWIASACTFIMAPKASTLGSIGAVSYYNNKNKDIFVTAGKYKAARFNDDNTALDEDFAQYAQEYANEIAETFFKSVALNRNLDIQFIKNLEAKVFPGPQALQLGLIDHVGTLKDLIQRINSLICQQNRRAYLNLQLVDANNEVITTFALA